MVADVAAYDEVAYPSVAHTLVRPDVMATLARLRGLDAPDIERASVLDLGCGDATHLISLAEAFPAARFLGVDLSRDAIGRGRRDIAELGLGNIRLEVADLTEWRPEPGGFDYALAHGLYSWTPPEVRDAAVAILGQALTEGGLATLSFNVAPGGGVRLMVRELLLEGTPTAAGPAERLRAARTAMEEALEAPSVEDATAAALRAELAVWAAKPPGALLHDLLSAAYAPARVGEVAAHAAHHGLGFLGDAQRGDFRRAAFPTARDLRIKAWAGPALAAVEHRHDLLSANPFRHAVLRKGGTGGARDLDAAAVSSLHAALSRRALGNVGAPGDDGAPVTVRDPEGVEALFAEPEARALLHRLEAAYPASVAVGDLAPSPEEARQLAHLHGLFAVDLSTVPARGARDPGERPRATPFACLQARLGRPVVRLDQSMAEPDALSRRLLARLDGTADEPALAAATAAEMGAPQPLVAPMVRERLRGLAREGLLLS